MKFFLPALVLVFLGVAPAAHAAPIFALGGNVVFETSTDGRSLEARQPLSVRGGYRFDLMDTYLEYSNFRVSSGSTMTYVWREHQEFILWGRKLLDNRWSVSPYAAFGAGFEYEHVTTNFGMQHTDDQSDPVAMAAAALGVRFVVWEGLDLQLEGRLGFAPDFSPNPLPGVGIVAGWSF